MVDESVGGEMQEKSLQRGLAGCFVKDYEKQEQS